MEQNTIIVLIICGALVILVAVFLILRKAGGSFTATGRRGKTKVTISTESSRPEAPTAGQIKIKGATSKRGSIEAATDKGGKIDMQDATAELDVKANTSGNEPPSKKA